MSDTPTKQRVDETQECDMGALAYQLAEEMDTLRERLAEAERWKEEYRDRLTFEEQETKKAEQRAERAETMAAQNAKDAERIDFLGAQNKWNGGTGYCIFMLDSGDVYVRPMKPENAHSVGATVHPDIRSAIDAARKP